MAVIILGNGNITAVENVSDDTITAGNGNDDITVIGNNDTLTVGGGNNTIILTSNPLFNTGQSNKLVAGNGNNQVNTSDTDPSLNFTLSVDGDSDGAGGVGINILASNYASQAATTSATDFYGTPTTVNEILNYDGSFLPNSIIGETYSWAASNMTLGSGSNTVYGTIKTFELKAINGGILDNNTFTFGSMHNNVLVGNSITVGNGANNFIYGTMDTLSLVDQGYLYFPDPITLYYESQLLNPNAILPEDVFLLNDPGSLITGETITIAGNKITVGSGSGDHVYGTMNHFSLMAGQQDSQIIFAAEFSPGPSYAFWTDIGGIGLDGGQSGNSYTFGSNILTVGNGNSDELYGTLGTLSISGIGNGFIGAYGGGFNNFFFGGNTLIAGYGNGDSLFGTLQEFVEQFVGMGGFDDGTNTFVFNANNLLVTYGNNDQLFGTMQDMKFIDCFVGADDPGGNAFIFGTQVGNLLVGNTLTAGNGNNDVLYGTMQEFLSDDAVLGADGGSTPTVPAGNIFNFGANTLNAGYGNYDILYGTMSDFIIISDFGSVGGFPDFDDELQSGGDAFNFAGNTLIVGNGISDQLYGTLKDFSLTANNFSIIGGAGGFIDAIDTSGFYEPGGYNDFTFGNNHLLAGSGNGDQLFGTMHDLSLTAISPETVIGGLGGGDNTFTFGNNTLIAGNGNDVLYGTLHDISLSATNGAVIGDAGGGYSNFNAFTFGNNTLTAGKGTDVLYADMHDLIVNVDATSSINGNIITFGTSVINAGNGTDTLVGEIFHVDITGESLAQFNSQNTINPGKTTFNLGTGIDTLVFDLGIDMGTNIVNNFNASKDILEFTNASSANVASAQASVQSMARDGHGGTLVTFNTTAGDSVHANGGTIDFTNIHYSGQTQLVDLVNHQASHIIVIV